LGSTHFASWSDRVRPAKEEATRAVAATSFGEVVEMVTLLPKPSILQSLLGANEHVANPKLKYCCNNQHGRQVSQFIAHTLREHLAGLPQISLHVSPSIRKRSHFGNGKMHDPSQNALAVAYHFGKQRMRILFRCRGEQNHIGTGKASLKSDPKAGSHACRR